MYNYRHGGRPAGARRGGEKPAKGGSSESSGKLVRPVKRVSAWNARVQLAAAEADADAADLEWPFTPKNLHLLAFVTIR